MPDNEYIPRPEAVGAAPRTTGKAPSQVNQLKGLVLKERQLTEKALEETLTARHERDQYRRVLAACLRGEAIVSDRCATLEEELEAGAASLADSLSEGGRLQGANSQLGERLDALDSARDDQVAAIKLELQAERERFERELGRATLERGQAEGRLAELQRKFEQDAPAFARFLRVRAIGLFVCAGVTFSAAVAFLPPLLRALFGSSSAEDMQLAVGLGGWPLLGIEAALLALAIALFTRGMRDFKASAPAS